MLKWLDILAGKFESLAGHGVTLHAKGMEQSEVNDLVNA